MIGRETMSELIINEPYPPNNSKRLRYSWQVIKALTDLGFTDFQAIPRHDGHIRKQIKLYFLSVNGLRWPYYLPVIRTALRSAGYIPPRYLTSIIALLSIGVLSTDWLTEFRKWLTAWVNVWGANQ